ncbi:hypothetical protein CI238_10906 [Colletotrichum incanum]|uniref:Uncharacterized protein n=1 Tax=Colletotrichum incanum TaxID=1573173 RepID=A0A167B6M7_COLIC|nr:hypothetical protein CI238_10906 [Colletotrichum incanum]OHW94968.1 hypothetical protein CSPAE12_06394 [Colletotrichum incanum]
MHFRRFFPPAILVSGALAGPAWRVKVRRQDGPVDPNTAVDCTWYYDTAYDSSFDCQYFVDSWDLQRAGFIDYNPSAGQDCSNIKVGNSYSAEVNNGLSRPTTHTTTSTAAAALIPTNTGPKKPSPTQESLIDSCVKFHKALAGNICNKIINLYGALTFEDFYKWNPAVGPDCSGLWAQTYYCVGIPGTSTGAPISTAALASTGPTKPSPTQDGLIDACTGFYEAVAGDTCDRIVRSYGPFNLADFYKCNPAVGTSCSGLWAETYYCVGVPDTPGSPPATTAAPQPTTPAWKPLAQSPTQPSIVCS